MEEKKAYGLVMVFVGVFVFLLPTGPGGSSATLFLRPRG